MLRANIVAVIGTTGAGKSQLAIDLAQRLRGEIISVDSLQGVYSTYCSGVSD